MAYSLDFRKKVMNVKTREELSLARVAKRFAIGLSTLVRWTKRLEAKKTRNKPCSKIDMNKLKEDLELYPDAYGYERAERLGASKTGIWYALHRLGVTYKKNPQSSKGGSRKKIYILQTDS